MESGSFSIVPLEVVQDSRLTLRHIKVLVALFSFRSKNTNTVFPSRKKLSEITGIREDTISLVTTELVKLGWLNKEGKGGFSMSAKYTITVPDLETLPDSSRVHDLSTLPDSSRSTLPESSRSTLPKLGRGKEVTIEHTNEHTSIGNASPKGDAQDKKPPREKRANRLPDDWELPDDYAKWCRDNRPDLNPHKVADQFKDYWIAQAGAKSRKADWFATWRNWCRNQKAENQMSFAERDEQAKANWYAQASGRTPVYEPDVFDMAVADSRQHLRIAK